jgi:hypothetical protein
MLAHQQDSRSFQISALLQRLPDYDCPADDNDGFIRPVMIHLLDISVGLLGAGESHSVNMSASLQPLIGPMLSGVAVLIALISTGCACGRVGTLAQRRTLTETAEVIDVYGVGALLRPSGVDAGFALGWQHATYIYPRLPEDRMGEGARWSFGWLPQRRADPFFLALSGVGAGVVKYPTILQSYVGFRMDAITFAASDGESRAVKFFYQPGAPEKTRLSINPFPKTANP